MKFKIYITALLCLAMFVWSNAQIVSVTVGVSQPASLVADAGTTVAICEGDTITLGGTPSANGGTGPYLYSWSPSGDIFADSVANPDAWPTTSTNYVLMVTDSNNCSSSDTISVTVNARPAVIYNFIQTGLTVSFQDLTPGTNTAWFWDFGDGNTSTSQNPSNTYSANGTYTVCLTVTSSDGCTDSLCKNVIAMVGVAEQVGVSDIRVWPNPYTENVTIDFELLKAENVDMKIYTVDGKMIGSLVNEKLGTGKHSYTFSAKDSGFSAGIYYLKMKVGEKEVSFKLVELE